MAELTKPDSDLLATPASEQASQERKRSVRIWQAIFVLILLAFVGLLAARLIQTNQSEHRASGEAPPFTFTTFEGETISLSDLAGKGVVLNFWASWCAPCRDEAAMLEATWRREQNNGIIFIGLDYLDQEPAARAYLEEFGVTYPNGPDLQSAAARRYGIKGVPETFFIDPQGNIQELVIGPIVSQSQMDDLLNKIRP
jgi:cytochrome c biogenesis protein CcmG/thiol:disulfide interchange protein DsbE